MISLSVRGSVSSASASPSISHHLDGVYPSESPSSRHLTPRHRPALGSQDKTHLRSRKSVGATHVTSVGDQSSALSSRSVAGNERENLRHGKDVFAAPLKEKPSKGDSEQESGSPPLAFIKLKTQTASVMDSLMSGAGSVWSGVKSGASAAKESFDTGEMISVMSSPALAGTGSPLAMPPVVAPEVDQKEATSMHGALIVLLCVGMVGFLLAVVGACFCLKRQQKHAKFMRMKPKDLVKKVTIQ